VVRPAETDARINLFGQRSQFARSKLRGASVPKQRKPTPADQAKPGDGTDAGAGDKHHDAGSAPNGVEE
jgi:hypothetical protein